MKPFSLYEHKETITSTNTLITKPLVNQKEPIMSDKMKLYTEEQIKAIEQWARSWDLYEFDKEINPQPLMFKEFISTLTPIELPSDEEILTYVKSTGYYGHCTHEYHEGIEEGAKWMREQILKQQK